MSERMSRAERRRLKRDMRLSVNLDAGLHIRKWAELHKLSDSSYMKLHRLVEKEMTDE